MNKVLITGIDSFTGGHLSKYLIACGYDVYGTSKFKSSDKLYQCDITKKDNILVMLEEIKPDYLIHLAGISFTEHGDKEAFYKVNTIGTSNVLEAFIELSLNPKKIILVSSATVYGTQGLEVIDESLCAKPANHYGASKYAMESLTRGYFNKLPIIITRPFNYTGVGQSDNFLIPKIVNHFKENKSTIELGNLNVIREFNDIEFVCEVYKRLLENDSTGEVVNIASNRGIKLVDVIDMMNNIAGYTIEVKVNPAFVRKDEIKSLTGSNTKLWSMVGKIEQINFQNTLKKMYQI